MSPARKSGGEVLPASDGKKPRKEKRQLVRWDQELDTLLLLTVQSACNLTGVKVPWEKVAELMGPKFTEGAIVQHMSKLRIRREGAGQRVPPPLRRSVTAAAAAAGSGKGSLKLAKNSRKRKGRSDVLDNDDSDGLDAPEEDESDPEYIQNKKKHKSRRFSFSSSKKPKKNLDDEDDDDELMCGGAPFLQHTDADLESDQYESEEEDEDAAQDAHDDYESDSYRAAKLKLEQNSPTPRQSRVVKLPVTLGSRGQSATKSICGMPDPTPPPSAMGGSRNQNFFNNDSAMTSNNPNSMFVPQGNWNPGQMPTSQAPDIMYQPAHMFWPQLTPVVNNQILGPNDFIWSQHAPAFASGREGSLAVSGLPRSTWDSSSTTVEAPSVPSMTMNPSDWFMNSNPFTQDDGDDAR
ncbi:hypothetical protein F1880_008762 [Penicillium rolfsii]|nr:hypothetical protein F1880_008762 [Penicillium rolfsii]